MKFGTCILPSLAAVLGGSNMAMAVCAGNVLGIGTPAVNSAGGTTSYNIYDSSCKTVNTVSIDSTAGVCINRYFLCAVGTKNIEEYDDPTTGWSYTCGVHNGTAETCGSDTLTYCCTYGYITG